MRNMKINRLKTEIRVLTERYHELIEENSQGFLKILKKEIPEAVCNSNAIDGSTLMLKEAKNIILHGKVGKATSVKEVYLTKNLGAAMEAVVGNPSQSLSVPLILELHKKFLAGVDDAAAGQLRIDNRRTKKDARPGADAEFVYALLENLVKRYNEEPREFLEKIAFFHAEFETMRPFVTGNGQIGRLIVDKQLMALDFPPIIVQNRGNSAEYQELFSQYKKTGNYDGFTMFFALALVESLHRFIALLEGKKTIPLSKWAKNYNIKANIASNKAKRQVIPAFRHDGRWQIDADFTPEPEAEPWGDFITTPVE